MGRKEDRLAFQYGAFENLDAHGHHLVPVFWTRSPRGIGRQDHGAARWYWDGMVRGRELDIHWGCYGLVPLGIGRSGVGCMPTHVYT